MAARSSSDAESALFSGAEVEFLAEDDTVVMVPTLRMDTLHLICGDFGPFMPQVPTSVPLWLGIAMKKRGKCRLRAPEWMTVENLTQVLELERDSPQEFQPLPFHYVEVSRLLMDNESLDHDERPEADCSKPTVEKGRHLRDTLLKLVELQK
ncbi:hypothetical protein AXG93_1989s1010 [Marchantia polymorpha subsp. ruderalis]|uniref:DNA replication complex GINS protein PSF2 N-terminal domain-containing protein n=1 Tax=Marchantia polymorpha subsp. ruderalis TaxID=1480154 RepID=A0A176VNQ3_MARPO|nr:hypothetical protein AXG93_1989s1010 [Marchantia polymorpha subsp. ruderalis]